MNNKRKMLKKIASVGTTIVMVPSSWIKPTISSMILPAHAQTSDIPTIRARFEGAFSFATLDDVFVPGRDFLTSDNEFISTPFTRSLVASFDPILPPDDGSNPPSPATTVSLLVDPPFSASPSIIMTSEIDLATTVDILDAQNTIILTISVEIQFRE